MGKARDSTIHTIQVHGDFACYSRPEMKVERWSYPCPTPSSARGVFDAIYCHPDEFSWRVTKIEILKPLRYLALRRNEVKEKVNVTAVEKWMAGKADPEPIFADADKEQAGTDTRGRTQRQTMALRDVCYRLHARIRPWAGFEYQQQAFDEQFCRRVQHGKCWQQPYLGVRECVAFFGPVDEEAVREHPPVPFDQDVGLMLYDVFDLSKKNGSDAQPFVTLFRAHIHGGVLDVPDFESPEVLKPSAPRED